MSIRGEPELIETEPWVSKAWARQSTGVGYSIAQADELAALVVPEELVEYADASRASTNKWLKSITDEELEAECRVIENITKHPAYNYPASLEAIAWTAGRPVWAVMSIACFAHTWGHLEEMALLAVASRASEKT
jgi:hypothetical protein